VRPRHKFLVYPNTPEAGWFYAAPRPTHRHSAAQRRALVAHRWAQSNAFCQQLKAHPRPPERATHSKPAR